MNDVFSLANKRALVTGANTGIGQAIAIGLANAGAHVIAAGRSSCTQTVNDIESSGGTAESMSIDLSDPAKAAEQLLNIEKLDILVNNAGIIRREDSVNFTEADWDDVMDVNLKAVFMLCQSFAKSVLARNATGRIVNIASLLSFQGGIRVPAYTASKHGVAGVTKILANEWAAKGINVNAIAPGYIATNNTTALREDKTRSAEILGRIPMGRWGDPADISGATTFLCSSAANYITGAVINVDGGWLAR